MRRAFLNVTTALSVGLFGQCAHGQDVCSNGAQVPARYCNFFVHYGASAGGEVDQRIADNIGISSADQTRSIAFIIAIDSYPKLSDDARQLSAAQKDRERLQDYLINGQHFDEVIVLANDDATRDNIDFFLNGYLPIRGDEFLKKGRLLIAYSGHGRPETTAGAGDAAFVLSQADAFDSALNVYLMRNFASRIAALSPHYFHVLTLVNACFGGSAFGSTSGGNFNDETRPGSYAVTAGPDSKTVVSLRPDKGSVFFDLLISGLEQGVVAPPESGTTIAGVDGSTTQLEPITRTGELFQYLDWAIRRINQAHRRDPSFKPLARIWVGPEQSGVAEGGFFFLTKRPGTGATQPYLAYTGPLSGHQIAAGPPTSASSSALYSHKVGQVSATVMAFDSTIDESHGTRSVPLDGHDTVVPARVVVSSIKVPPGPVSSIYGHPEIKIFKSPNIYPIRGYDVSSDEGQINWKLLGIKNRPYFIYARALGQRGPDVSFQERWRNAGALNIDRGAYLTFNFCKSAIDQLEDFATIVPVDAKALPAAIAVYDPAATGRSDQAKCLQRVGLAAQQSEMLKLADLVAKHYNKVPLFYGNRSALSHFTDGRFDKFMLWLASYGASPSTALKLPGTNPWSLWQYSGTVEVPGIGDKVAGNVFFGTHDQYLLFKQGQTNIGRTAVTAH